MTILFVLIIASALVAGIFLIAFIWSVKSGQFDDSYTPSVRALFDDGIPENQRSEDIKPEDTKPEDSNPEDSTNKKNDSSNNEIE